MPYEVHDRYVETATKQVQCTEEEFATIANEMVIYGYLVEEEDDLTVMPKYQLKCLLIEHLMKMRAAKEKHSGNVEKSRKVAQRRKSYGTIPRSSMDDEEVVDAGERKSTGATPANLDQSIFNMNMSAWAIPFMRGEIGTFRGSPGDDGTTFLKNFEANTSSWTERAKVDGFHQFLKEVVMIIWTPFPPLSPTS